MLKFGQNKLKNELEQKLAETDAELAELNKSLADKMTRLAEQTGDTAPLIQAVDALHKAKKYYSVETAPTETLDVHEALADTLLLLGRENKDREALENSVKAYRNAITMASLIGDEDRRQDLKINYKLALTFLGQHQETPSLFKVA